MCALLHRLRLSSPAAVAACAWLAATTAAFGQNAEPSPGGGGGTPLVETFIVVALAGGCLYAVCRGSRKL